MKEDIVEMVSQQLFELSTVGIVILDSRGKLLKANGKLLEWLGYGVDEVEGKSLMELPFLSVKSKTIAVGNLSKRIAGVKIEPYLLEFVHKDGHRVMGRVDARVVEHNGEVVDLVMIADVTKDQEYEEEISRLKLGLEKSNDVIFITDRKGVFEYVNPAFMKVYGYTEDEWRGKTPRILKSGDKDEEWYKRFWGLLLSGKTVRATMTNKTRDGRLLEIEAVVNPIVDSFGNVDGFLAIQRDVTDIHEVLRNLRSKTEDLERMNRLMVGREIKMIEMKKEIDDLRRERRSG